MSTKDVDFLSSSERNVVPHNLRATCRGGHRRLSLFSMAIFTTHSSLPTPVASSAMPTFTEDIQANRCTTALEKDFLINVLVKGRISLPLRDKRDSHRDFAKWPKRVITLSAYIHAEYFRRDFPFEIPKDPESTWSV